MMSRRSIFTFTGLALTSLVLFQFQNCAPAASSVSSSSPGAGGDMRIVDDLNKAELQFATQSVQVHELTDRASFTGLCSRTHNGARLRWAIRTGDDLRPLMEGMSSCARGQFGVQIAALGEMVCGVDHLLVVEGEWGGSTFTHISKRCQPLASEESAAPEGSPMGTQCEIEYQPASDAVCTEVCYRDQKVVLSRPLESSRCSGLAARLAGP